MVGNSRATDAEIMAWARQRRQVVFTHDLDLGTILATSNAEGPSVLQMRAQDVLPSAVGRDILRVLRDHPWELEHGAIVTVDEVRFRVRILPILKR
jgi:predicted nuclease of predicted toxin-antitoxin system